MYQPPTPLRSECWIACQMDGVSDRVPDGVLDEVSDEVPDGGSDCDFSLLHTNHALDLYKHQTELN
jgi:hypothetical protein